MRGGDLFLRAGPMEVRLRPDLGGSIATWKWRGQNAEAIDLMRPLAEGAASSSDAACFPLTPYSNRIRKGQFEFGGRHIQIGNADDGSHALHGHGWRRPWDVETARDASAILRYRHQPDDWPFAYEIRQIFDLHSDRLEVALQVRNLTDQPMPYGFGLHPYFPKTAATTLRAEVRGFWEVDGEVLPRRLIEPVPTAIDMSHELRLADIELDNGFTGWGGTARIDWPERRLALTIEASEALRQLVVYVPKGKGYFCVEPVSNMTDAFNFAHSRKDTGMIVLDPGGAARASVAFRLQQTGSAAD